MGNFFYSIAIAEVWLYFRLRYRMRIHNRHNLPKLKGMNSGYIIACNHQSYADPPAIGAVIRGRFAFMAKEELFTGNKLFAKLIRMCGAFPVRRGGGGEEAIAEAIRQLKKGRTFVIFPEGKRSKDGEIGRAKSGVALIAAMTKAPVLPVCIMYGLGGKRNLDFAIGEMIMPEEITIDDLSDRKRIKEIAELIIGRVRELQSKARARPAEVALPPRRD